MIKEFDLDAPNVQKPKRLQFRNETRCVTALFERCYKPSKETGKPWKILVEVVTKAAGSGYKDLLGVLTTQVESDIDRFLGLDNSDKKPETLELLMRGIGQVASALSLDMMPFETAAAEVEKRGFINEWIWGSEVANSSKTMSAEILVNHDVEAATLSARIRNGSGKVVNVLPLVSDQPNEFIFDEYFGSLSWLDDNTIELASRNGKKRYAAKVI